MAQVIRFVANKRKLQLPFGLPNTARTLRGSLTYVAVARLTIKKRGSITLR
jgi:hypothetical protein